MSIVNRLHLLTSDVKQNLDIPQWKVIKDDAIRPITQISRRLPFKNLQIG